MKKLSQFFNVKVNIDVRVIVILIMLFLINTKVNGQAATTFTASDIIVTNTITAGGAIKGQCITAADTMRAKQDIVAEKDLQVSGNVEVSNNILVNKNISLGVANDFISFGYSPATATSPSIFKVFPPSTGPLNPQNPGDPSSPDPTPNLACVLGLNYLSSFPNAISIKQNLNNQTAGTGGNLVLGHTGAKAFIESQGGGTGPLNHQGDLFINNTCSRNVLFFAPSALGFGNNLTNAVSISGKLNLTENMQIGIPSALNFVDNNSKLFIQANGSASNGIKIKHGDVATYGIKVVEFNDAEKAFGVFKTPNSTVDGAERFSVQGDGKTLITTTNSDALQVADGSNNNQVNYKVKNTGATEISNMLPTTKAFLVKDNIESFLVWGNGNTHIATNAQIGFGTLSTLQDPGTKLYIGMNTVQQVGNQNGIRFNVMNNTAKLIFVTNSNFATSPFTVRADGQTQIGGEFNGSSAYMLTVNGKVGAREIRVSIQTTWPDYVFEKNYKLQSLDAIQHYVKENKHLPNIPSAKELTSEECGLDLAQMQGRQMEKIEDIYLYLFEMKKEIENLKKENKELKNKLNK
jgi:hypothetical protein